MPRDLTPKPAGWSDLLVAIESLERRVTAEANDAAASYKLAVLLLEAYGWTRERRQLGQARDALKQAVRQRPNHAPSHAVLGFVCHQGGPRGARQALACMSEAQRLNPRDRIYEVYLIDLLLALGEEKKALAARPPSRGGSTCSPKGKCQPRRPLSCISHSALRRSAMAEAPEHKQIKVGWRHASSSIAPGDHPASWSAR